MSQVPTTLKYTATHEWIKQEQDGSVTVGITDHAQALLGDLVFVQLPEQGDEVNAQADVAVVESVKAASDVYAPISGKITATNQSLTETPELINQDPYTTGWIFKIMPSNPQELAALLDAATYEKQIQD
jgi:glycine cleavage system H protein